MHLLNFFRTKLISYRPPWFLILAMISSTRPHIAPLALHVARYYIGGLLWEIARSDALQIAAIATWQFPDGGTPQANCVRRWADQTLRAMGFCRVRIPNCSTRRWMNERQYWYELATGQRELGYRAGSRGKISARLKVSPERRKEIARLGGLARAKRRKRKEQTCL